jgi:hypothetical protein
VVSWSPESVSDDLESRAAYGAQVHAQRVEAQQRGFTPSPVKPELNAFAKRALIEAAGMRDLLPDALVFLATLLAVALAGVSLQDDVKLAVITCVAIGIPGLIATVIAGIFRRARQVRAALAWFDALPFAFDRRHYLELLGEERSGTRVELQVTFTAKPTPQEMEMYANVASGCAALADRRSKGHVLTLTSVPLKTSFSSYDADRGSYNSNHQVHAWMLKVIDGALRPIHERQPIERVTVKIESAIVE